MTDTGSEPPAPAAPRIARHLLNREGVRKTDVSPAVVAAGLERVCERVAASLRDALGPAGYDALLSRSLARTEPAHPALKDICHRDGGRVDVEILLANVEAHGVAGVIVGIEALFAALIDILSRLIGEEMAIRLVEQDFPRPGGGAPPP